MNDNNNPRSPEEEIRRIIEKYGSMEVSEEWAQTEEPVAPADTDTAAASADDEPAALSSAEEFPLVMPVEEEDAPGKRRKPKRTPGQVLLSMVEAVIPHVGDGALEVLRKCVFMLALLTLVGSLSYLTNDLMILPAAARDLYAQTQNKYNPDSPVPLPPELEDFDFLPGMDDSFKLLYTENTDLRGFISYTSNKANDFLKINLPIVKGIDNAYYLEHDFHKSPTKFGCLFFDMRNTIETPEDYNKSLIIYGHNMASGDMFAGLNKFIGSLSNVRSAPLITMNTLFEKAQYKVFAMAVMDESENAPSRYYYTRTDFGNDEDFLTYIDEIRARSLWDYEQVVDVNADDEILILSTCTVKSAVHFDDGRLAVFARKVRPGESADVAVNKIKANDDVIMPLAWYLNQNIAPHAYYTENGYQIPSTSGTAGNSSSAGQATGSQTPDPGPTTPPPTSGDEPAPTQPGPEPTKPTKPGPDPSTQPPDPTESTDNGDTTDSTAEPEPTNSTDPDEPTSTTEPTEPTEPVDPSVPDEPGNETEPNQPAEGDPTEADPVDPTPAE